MGTPVQRSRRRGKKDVSIVLDTRKWRESPAFVEAAVHLEQFISCEDAACGKVIGVGVNRDEAIDDVHENKTGDFIDGLGWRCKGHAPAVNGAGK